MTIGLFKFTTAPKSLVSKDLLAAQLALGGQFGIVTSGMDKVEALKVRENVFVTARKPAASLKAMMGLGRADVHVVDHPSEIQFLKDRLEALESG